MRVPDIYKHPVQIFEFKTMKKNYRGVSYKLSIIKVKLYELGNVSARKYKQISVCFVIIISIQTNYLVPWFQMLKAVIVRLLFDQLMANVCNNEKRFPFTFSVSVFLRFCKRKGHSTGNSIDWLNIQQMNWRHFCGWNAERAENCDKFVGLSR